MFSLFILTRVENLITEFFNTKRVVIQRVNSSGIGNFDGYVIIKCYFTIHIISKNRIKLLVNYSYIGRRINIEMITSVFKHVLFKKLEKTE